MSSLRIGAGEEIRMCKMRKQRGWGHGFEQTFLVDDSVEDAAAKGLNVFIISCRRRSLKLRYCNEDRGPIP